MIRTIDGLNNIEPYDNKITDVDKWLEDYFKSMPATKEEKQKRKDASKQIRDAIIFLLLLLREMAQYGNFDYEYTLEMFRIEFTNAIRPYVAIDYYITDYINRETQTILDNTLDHIDKPDASYFNSDDRATVDGAGSAHAVVSYDEYTKALKAGKTKKKWRTQLDNRVRHTHSLMEGQIKPISDFFIVGGTAMLFPCDPDCTDIKETANCRCHCKFF